MSGQSTDRYREAKRIAMAVLDNGAGERDSMLAHACGDDAALAREVRWMLDAVERSRTATLPLLPGDTIDLSGNDALAVAPRRYRLLRRVGEGGMGVVYLAEREDAGFTQQVALKVLNATAVGSSSLQERFVRERQLLARLEHPGIARLLDGGMLADGQPFLAMEYVEGERIDAWCASHGLDLRARVALFLKVCAAVEYAHRSLVIHRDLKPGNILVDARGQPKLLDFGIARLIDEPALEATLTEAGQHALTLAYASPEQIELQPLTTAVDVYGLGMVLYQLVAGRRPWQHITTPHQLSHAIVTGEVVPPSRGASADGGAGRRSVPADVDAIVLKALRRQASERYASVAALADDLRNWLAQRPVQARRGQRLYRARRYLQRHRWPLAAAASLLLSVLAGLAVSLFALQRARAQQQLAEQRQHQLERMVQFQQSMYDSVDIGAMGQAVVAATQRQVDAALAPVASGAVPRADGILAKAFASVRATDVARAAFDTYVVAHTLDNLDRAFSDAPQLATDLRQSLARVLMGIGSYAHAAEELRKVVAERGREPGDHPDLLSARLDLARAEEAQGHTREAAALYAHAVRQVGALASTDRLRLAAEAGEARTLMAEGRLQLALRKQQALLAELKPKLADANHDLMELERDQVGTLIKLGQRDRARMELERLEPLYRRTFGAEHPQTLATMLTLATLLYSQDNEYERSLVLAKEVAAIRRRRLGADHPATLEARALAASNEVRLAQDPATMEQVHQRLDAIIRSDRRVLGADNPHTFDAMTDMVRLLTKQDRYAEAIAMERAILAGRNRTLGPDHVATLYARGSLASLLCKDGDYAEAGALAEQVLAALRRQLGDDHPMTLATYDLVGRIDAGAGHWEQAREAHAKALEGRARTLGDTDAHTIESASRLYAVLAKLRDTAGARRVHDTYLRPVIAMNPGTLNAGMRSVREEALESVGR